MVLTNSYVTSSWPPWALSSNVPSLMIPQRTGHLGQELQTRAEREWGRRANPGARSTWLNRERNPTPVNPGPLEPTPWGEGQGPATEGLGELREHWPNLPSILCLILGSATVHSEPISPVLADVGEDAFLGPRLKTPPLEMHQGALGII